LNLSKDRIGGTLLLVFFACYGWLSFDIDLLPAHDDLAFNPRTLPYSLAMLGIVLAVSLIARSPTASLGEHQPLLWGKFASFLVLMSVYGISLRPLGFIAATGLFLICGFLLLGERRIPWLICVSLFITLGFWALMNFVLGVFIDPWPSI
jgi:putative tricarboxylic transport membrane protein